MRVLLGVGGGIAAYKAAELARALMNEGATVETVMTAGAQEFVRPLTFAALTGRKVVTDLFSSASPEATLSSAIEHISAAQENDVLVVAPATADLLAKFAGGLANDFLSTAYLAFTGPVVLAPAMNVNMWRHPATQANLETLRRRGHRIVEPDEGYLACGMVGPGRLAEIPAIVAAVAGAVAARRDLEGETVLITAGPTREPLDPVRFLSNRSSGKMGYALAEAAAARGAKVILVSGPVRLAPPPGVALVP
ncbi:MAG: bifunctional phosphopantothenoylcysteine decarboxylase/phosphopantothenate--cysteine ligase CoaBC, partial [Acidobacteria bacterium]|nr:bifunctional phosphopantothenoylcysteine decarboxylase/phosphopantothenate--cysteine ligase CoaBC [Acidobacteriota bacterium]